MLPDDRILPSFLPSLLVTFLEIKMNRKTLALLLLAAFSAGCKGGSDTADTVYNGQGRVRGPDQGWRPTVVLTPAER